MRVKDIPGEAVLIQDSQERRAVLERLGLEELLGEHPALFAEVGDAEYRRVWGLTSFVPHLDARAELLYGEA